ncbi:MAG: hypothetical protein A2Y62_06590 [Candidatus Fischerbacteria bacterium RBG_13_37_8]|uniref:Fibronectin type-III domain-containing protein n=1 Tax=Candidatus Fischerbacteria bacterium RBG_13_37_8 TaxID=1817863 RepID=A0A1F5VU79_9BACT|nr:MAG: hypothetical protein A2Y62_06590 [Candidatus Fischerbacteria bacterium RBG_13_37_8]
MASDTLICPSFSAPGTIPDNNNYIGTPLTIMKAGTSSLILNWAAPGGTCLTQDYGIYRGTLPWAGYDYASILCTTSGQNTAMIVDDL